jgi:hypothetical protein
MKKALAIKPEVPINKFINIMHLSNQTLNKQTTDDKWNSLQPE